MGESRRNRSGAADGSGIGTLAVSEGALWHDLTAASFSTVTGKALPGAGRISTVTVLNTHATQTLYLLLRAGAATAVADSIPVPALASAKVDCLRVAAGEHVTALSVQGSGAATTAQLTITTVDVS